MSDDVEIVSLAICQSGKFETGEGTCALRCMDQLGDARKRPCQHIVTIHGDLARSIVEALKAKEPTP